MRHRFALTLSLLFLLLCAAAWIRTHFCTDVLERHTQSPDGTVHHYVLGSTEGAVLRHAGSLSRVLRARNRFSLGRFFGHSSRF